MASPLYRRLPSSVMRARLATPALRTPLMRIYSSDSAPPPPPLLQKIRGDLKTAMRAKEATRLGVLRSVLSATLNASKTATPINTDAQLVALLRKMTRASQDAAEEFRGAGRGDLELKEQEQIKILDGYVAGSGVQDVSADDLRVIVTGVVTAMKSEDAVQDQAKMGDVMKKLLAPGGPLEGKSVEKAELAKVVKEVLG